MLSRFGRPFVLLFVALALAPVVWGAPARQRVTVISGEYEYSSMLTLRALSDQLKKSEAFDVTFLQRSPEEAIPGIAALKQSDLVIMFVRRMTLPPDQLQFFRNYLARGRPLIALRTSSHAFQNWKEFDHEVLGANYQDHFPGTAHAVAHTAAQAELLSGVPASFETRDSLYRLSPLADDAQLLMYGTLSSVSDAREPMTWTREYRGAKIFYSSLGCVDDFQHEPFMRLLGNAICWATGTHVTLQPIGSLAIHPITAAELPQFIGFSSYVMYDVRTPASFAAGHEKKAVNLDRTASNFTALLANVDPTRNYVVYADNERDARAVAQQLHERGCEVVHYLAAPYTRKN